MRRPIDPDRRAPRRGTRRAVTAAVGAVALAALVAACSSNGTTTQTAASSTTAAPGSSAASSSSTTTAAGASSTTAAAGAKVNANTASSAEIQKALEAAGVTNAARWTREVMEYRPYATDDPSLAKLKKELQKYNPSADTLSKILSALTV